MAEELKPCPLCSAKAELHRFRDTGFRRVRVHCPGCLCRTAHYQPSDEAELVHDWNRRPAEDAAAARVAELEQALGDMTRCYRTVRLAQGMTSEEVDTLPAVSRARALLTTVQS